MARKARAQNRRSFTLVAIVLMALVAAAGLYTYLKRPSESAGKTAAQISHIHGLGVDPAQPGLVWVATHDGLLRLDAQGQWTRVGQAQPDLMGFTLSPVEPGVMYSSGHPGQGMSLPNPVGLIASHDGGQSWQPVSLTGQADFHALAVSAANPGVMYGWHGQLYRSDDGGQSWVQLRPKALSTENTAPLQLAAHPGDAAVVAAATMQGFFRSGDRGETWESLLDGPVTAVSYAPGDPTQVLAYHLEQGLVRSADGGRTWQPLGYVAEGRDAVGYIAVDPADVRTVYIATFQGILARSRDGGGAWETLVAQGRIL